MLKAMMRMVIDNDDEDYFINDYLRRLRYCELTIMITQIIDIINMINENKGNYNDGHDFNDGIRYETIQFNDDNDDKGERYIKSTPWLKRIL